MSASGRPTVAPMAVDGLEGHFAERPEELVPTVDPFGNEYLRTSNVCERFSLPHARGGAPACEREAH